MWPTRPCFVVSWTGPKYLMSSGIKGQNVGKNRAMREHTGVEEHVPDRRCLLVHFEGMAGEEDPLRDDPSRVGVKEAAGGYEMRSWK
jgi:hypothetical protein